jgi:hypothetical protein
MRKRLCLICGFLLLAANPYGQVDRGSLSGTVRDSSRLVVLGVNIAPSQDGMGTGASGDR